MRGSGRTQGGSKEPSHRREFLPIVRWGGEPSEAGVGVFVDVELGHGDLLAELVRNLFERRSDHPARAAPLGPEIYEYRPFRTEDVGREALVGDGLGAHDGDSPSGCSKVNMHMGGSL